MDKVLVIIKREYLMRVRSKGFIIGTILSPLLMASFVLIPALLATKGGGNTHRVVVLDQTSDDFLFNRARKTLQEKSEKSDKYELVREIVGSSQLAARQQSLNQEISKGAAEAYLVLPVTALTDGKLTYHAKNVSDFVSSNRIEDAFNTAIREKRLIDAGIDLAKIEGLSKEIKLEKINERGEKEQGQSFILAYVLLMILYITILVYGIMVMRGVIEEKQSRIVEILLSSVRPFQLLLGKLIGIGMVGLTQYVTWAVCAFAITGFAAAQAFAFGEFKLPHIPASTLIFFVVFFILGYFLYATLYAVVGAIVSSEEDGQQVQMPVTASIIVPMALSSMILRNPDSLASTVLSMIPIFSPILMFMRITIKQPPWWQIGLSIVLLIATILGVVWVAAKIYRVGVLMYGKRPTLPELAKWLKYS